MSPPYCQPRDTLSRTTHALHRYQVHTARGVAPLMGDVSGVCRADSQTEERCPTVESPLMVHVKNSLKTKRMMVARHWSLYSAGSASMYAPAYNTGPMAATGTIYSAPHHTGQSHPCQAILQAL